MKRWFTAAELAALKLPGLPETEEGIAAWMGRVRQDNPRLVRELPRELKTRERRASPRKALR